MEKLCNRKGIKVGSSSVFFDDEFHKYTIHLDKLHGFFFVNTTDLALFDLLMACESHDFEAQFDMFFEFNKIGKIMDEVVDKYIESKIEHIAIKEKVILFELRMTYALDYKKPKKGQGHPENQVENRDDFSAYTYCPKDAPSLKFNYRVVVRVKIEDEVIRYEDVDDPTTTHSIDMDEKELEWTEHNEAFFKSLKDSLTGLCYKLDNFFGKENNLAQISIDKGCQNLLDFTSNK